MHLSDVTQAKTEKPSSAGFPLRAWIALTAILVIIAFAAYVMYERVVGTGSDARGLVEVGGARRAVDFGGPRIIPDGIRISGNMHQVKAGDARLTITKRADGTWNYNFSYDKPDLLTPDQQNVFTARFRLARDATYAKSLNVTEDQAKRLRDLPAREGMVVSAPDRKRIERIFEDYLKAPQPREKQTGDFVAALRQVGDNSLTATRQTIAQRVGEIQAILTPEQLERFKRPAN